MPDREKERRAAQSRRDRGSFTLREWCDHRRVSMAMFYKLRGMGLAPKTHRAGSKNLISDQADLEWVRAREADTADSESTTA
jgi:hypothetical protein